MYYPAQPSFPLCLGVNVRDNPDGASSFSACGTEPSPYKYSCGCAERDCSSYYYAVNCTGKRFKQYMHDDTDWSARVRAQYNTTQALMDYARTQCTFYEVCTVRDDRPDIMAVINSRDGTKLTSRGVSKLSQDCDLTEMSSILSLVTAMQAAGTACTGSGDTIADCSNRACQDAVLEATSHPCLIVSVRVFVNELCFYCYCTVSPYLALLL